MTTADNLVKMLGQKGVDELVESLSKIDADKEWQKLALGITTRFVESHGAQGIDLAWKAIKDSMEGKSPDLTGLGIRESSEVLAKLQQKELRDQSDVEDWFVGLGEALGPILVAILANSVAAD